MTLVSESYSDISVASCVIVYDDVRHSRELCDASQVRFSSGAVQQTTQNRWQIVFHIAGAFKEDTEYEFVFASGETSAAFRWLTPSYAARLVEHVEIEYAHSGDDEYLDPSLSHEFSCMTPERESTALCEFSWQVWISHGSFRSELTIPALESAGVAFALENQLVVAAGAISRYTEIAVGCSAYCEDGARGFVRRNFTAADPIGASFVVTPLSGFLDETNFFFAMLQRQGSKVDFECSYGYLLRRITAE